MRKRDKMIKDLLDPDEYPGLYQVLVKQDRVPFEHVHYDEIEGFNFQAIKLAYSEKQRYHHTLLHLDKMCSLLISMLEDDSFLLVTEAITSREDFITFILAILYHDFVYNPLVKDNEERSSESFRKRFNSEDESYDLKRVLEIIRSSDLTKEVKEGSLEDLFRNLDCEGFTNSKENLLKNELNIMKEYQFLSWEEYQKGRREFFNKIVDFRIGYNAHEAMEMFPVLKPRVAVYAGSFSNFHIGHLSILRQAEKIFDKVIVAVAEGSAKSHKLKSIMERYGDLKSLLCFHEVTCYDGFSTDYLASLGYPTLIRGLRTDTDFKAEEKQLRILQGLDPKINVIFIPCEKEHEHVSSTTVIELNRVEKDRGTKMFLPDITEIYKLSTVSYN
jgi:pantetheine-phosphate adenylyltransferase